MARDTLDDTPIESVDQLAAWMDGGCKPKSDFRIGTEHEKFAFYRDEHTPVGYEGPRGIRQLLEGMEALLGWDRIMDGPAIIGLADPTGGGAISLEPGGQFELSGAPLDSIHQTCKETHSHLAQLREIADPLGIGFLGLGASPKWRLKDTPRMPKSRYDIMTNYMPKVGSLGLDMMYRTSTIQVNLDFADEADMVRKMQVGIALQPIATAIFANSPFLEGKPNGFLSYRAEVWRHTDPDRTGMIPFVFQPGFGFETYVEWAVDVPMYFVKRGDTYHDVTGWTFRDFMNGKLDLLPGERPNVGDWNNHLSTLFPEVRLKRYIEMRGADGGPWRKICALPAFWVGLLYDDESLSAAADLVADWTGEERQTLRDRVPKEAFDTPFRGGTVHDIARTVVDLSRKGLARRGRLNQAGFDETSFLATIEECLATGETPAQKMLRKYHVEWGGSIEPVFDEFAY
ncbi:glutamate--cysteine ligase [Rhodobium orientis]|uniref:Glutamate--cysteine ligase n=1 Tax=Rhodobium orientis TaxID=34017 RepID=A0A327JER7_9HYPH|nr:glutamate--cysteine ligase [Rhodobium orientis]MBB4304126.1 glutamate--cysteine ligase [Rhodobium orientis]MBK5948635.1 glutamate--cysteine ligase [Rhodobium orientis]RAI24890.1 glutamate--cysteine ligase [Rhodobium orientis]